VSRSARGYARWRSGTDGVDAWRARRRACR
jgi:hypothetical protein